MNSIANMIENPNSIDKPVNEVFTDDMYNDLEKNMRLANIKGLEETRTLWENDYSNRLIIKISLRIVCKKRLISMPDRVTNTISMKSNQVLYRPSVINCYQENLIDINDWYKKWKFFLFYTQINQISRNSTDEPIHPYNLLNIIKHSKYPTISIDEENISIPLQILCLAIFDSILLYIVNLSDQSNRRLLQGVLNESVYNQTDNQITRQLSDKFTWRDIRLKICDKLNLNKLQLTINILTTNYLSQDIIFLQEVSKNFNDIINHNKDGKKLVSNYNIISSNTIDNSRDQNSMILLKKSLFIDYNDITNDVINYFHNKQNRRLDNKIDSSVPIMPGDLLCITTMKSSNSKTILKSMKYLLCSFHGDTNGLATKSVVQLVHDYAMDKLPDHRLIFGLDGNTYAHPEKDQQGLLEFAEFYNKQLHMNSCYGSNPSITNYTTFHARTYLQPQLNKAIRIEDKDVLGDKNPKDHILFFESDYQVIHTYKDNTGKKIYKDNMVFPTLNFPSDHGITSTILKEL